MDIEAEDVEGITSAVWATMLEAELEAVPGPADPASVPEPTVGYVDLDGAWNGTVSLHISQTTLRQAAAALFDVEPAEASDDQLHDTMAELANMVGGNVKCLVEQPSQLSLPTVTNDESFRTHVDAREKAVAIGFGNGGNELVVTIFQDKAA